jgi:hypothetical protein
MNKWPLNFFSSVQSGIHFLYAPCTTCYVNIRRFPSGWNDLADWRDWYETGTALNHQRHTCITVLMSLFCWFVCSMSSVTYWHSNLNESVRREFSTLTVCNDAQFHFVAPHVSSTSALDESESSSFLFWQLWSWEKSTKSVQKICKNNYINKTLLMHVTTKIEGHMTALLRFQCVFVFILSPSSIF